MAHAHIVLMTVMICKTWLYLQLNNINITGGAISGRDPSLKFATHIMNLIHAAYH